MGSSKLLKLLTNLYIYGFLQIVKLCGGGWFVIKVSINKSPMRLAVRDGFGGLDQDYIGTTIHNFSGPLQGDFINETRLS